MKSYNKHSLWLYSFTYLNFYNIQPCCKVNQYFIPSHHWIKFHYIPIYPIYCSSLHELMDILVFPILTIIINDDINICEKILCKCMFLFSFDIYLEVGFSSDMVTLCLINQKTNILFSKGTISFYPTREHDELSGKGY